MPLARLPSQTSLQKQSHAFTRQITHRPQTTLLATSHRHSLPYAKFDCPLLAPLLHRHQTCELASTLLALRRLSDMCFFVASQHSCGHLHERFGRCFFAQRDSNYACNEPSFPIWQHSDPFPCPDCYAHRKADTNELLSAKGGKRTDAPKVKKETMQQDRRSSTQSAGQNVPTRLNQQSVDGEYANIGDQLQTLADNALHTSPLPNEAASPPWIPPSQRYASIVGQLGSSPPPQSLTHDTTSPLSNEMLSGRDFSRPDSAVAPAFSEQLEMDPTQFALLLRQAE